MRDDTPMYRYLILAMKGRGEMSLHEIYKQVKAVCKKHGRELPPQWEAEIRQTLQAHCASSSQFQGRGDYFEHRGRGRWFCKAPSLEEILADI